MNLLPSLSRRKAVLGQRSIVRARLPAQPRPPALQGTKPSCLLSPLTRSLSVLSRPASCHRVQRQQVSARAQVSEGSDDLGKDAITLRRIGWVSFWAQLALSVVSSIVLFFTVTSQKRSWLPGIPVYFTLAGVAFSFISTFFAYGYTRISRRVIVNGEKVKRSNVVGTLLSSTRLNLIGIGSTIVGLQASVGQLVGKTLTSSTSNPYATGQAVAQSTPTAIDVFSVQASTNTLMAHFVSIVFANWLLRLLNKNAPPAKGTPAPA